MTQWEKLLKSLGFTESESKIYLLSLEAGPAAVQDLAKKAKVSRVTTYAVIEQLMKDGLMSTVQKGKKQLYVAESPERLLSFVHSRVKTMEATLREIESSLPDLKLLQRGEKPIVKLLEGIEGLRALQADVIQTAPKHIDEFANLETVLAVFSDEELRPFKQELKRMNVTGRFLYTGNKTHTGRNADEVRKIKSGVIMFDGDIVIYKNKTAFSTFHGKLITVIIESDVIAQTVKSLFDMAWHSSLIEK